MNSRGWVTTLFYLRNSVLYYGVVSPGNYYLTTFPFPNKIPPYFSVNGNHDDGCYTFLSVRLVVTVTER